MKKADKLDYLQTHHLRLWVETRKQVFEELSKVHDFFCLDGHIASGGHLSRCERFNNRATNDTIEKLSHLLPKENRNEKV